MSTNEFDKLIIDKFNQHEFEFKPAQWEKLSKELGEPKETKKTIPLTGGWWRTAAMAAGILAVVSVFGWLYTANDTEENDIAASKTEQTTTPATITSGPTLASHEENQTAAPANDAEVVNKQTTKGMQAIHNYGHGSAPVRRISQAGDGTTANTAQGNSNVPNSNVTIAGSEQTQQQQITDKQPEALQTAITFQPKTNSPKPNNVNLSHYPDDQPMPQRQKPSDASIGLTGGMNYGSLDAGYVAGVTARKKVAGKMFVEGDLAFVSNKADQASMSEVAFNVASSGDVNALGSGVPLGVQGVKSNSLETATNSFNYLQFTPSIGYQVVPKLSVSVGADFQRLLGYDDDMKNVVFENAQTKLAPTMDVGITGKTEIAVTRKLKAGLLYREGVNNMVRGSTTKQYLERRYLQVQLKFNVFDRN